MSEKKPKVQLDEFDLSAEREGMARKWMSDCGLNQRILGKRLSQSGSSNGVKVSTSQQRVVYCEKKKGFGAR